MECTANSQAKQTSLNIITLSVSLNRSPPGYSYALNYLVNAWSDFFVYLAMLSGGLYKFKKGTIHFGFNLR